MMGTNPSIAVDTRQSTAWRQSRATAWRKPRPIQRRTIGLLIGFGIAIGACARHADLRDELAQPGLAATTAVKAGNVPVVDSGIAPDDPPCGQRPQGACVGPVDFPCAMDYLVSTTAIECQKLTGCRTNGWLRVTMSQSGCVESLGMDQPNDAMLACLVGELGAVRCPCPGGKQDHFFGLGHTGDATGTPCP